MRDETVQNADLIGFYLPMHTATRLAEPVILRTRTLNRAARMCAYGLYAPLNAEWLRSLGVDEVLGPEFEEELTRYAGLKACTTDSLSQALKACTTDSLSQALKACTPSSFSQAQVRRDLQVRSVPRLNFL